MRVTVVSLFVTQCTAVCVCYNTPGLSSIDRTLKFRHRRSVNDTIECFDSWILLTMVRSRNMTKFVSKEVRVSYILLIFSHAYSGLYAVSV